jgi:lipoyl(octanoyl) transferase
VEATLSEPVHGVLGATAPIHARWLGRIDYREAHSLQKRLVDERALSRIPDQLLLLEHPAVLTLGKHSDPAHILASAAELQAKGISVERIERGGEVTYHGPGQLVAYPVMRLHERGLLVRPFVRALEAAMVDTCVALGVAAARRAGHPGCWCEPDVARPRKIGAVGLRIERGVSYHGIALNITVDLDDFALIDACGMPGVESTSIARELDRSDRPSTESVEEAAWTFARSFASAIDAPLVAEA